MECGKKIGFGRGLFRGEPYLLFGFKTIAKQKNGNPNYYQNYSPDKLEVLFIDVERRKRLAVKKKCLHNWAILMKGAFWILLTN